VKVVLAHKQGGVFVFLLSKKEEIIEMIIAPRLGRRPDEAFRRENHQAHASKDGRDFVYNIS
jgi:hypothetical protein